MMKTGLSLLAIMLLNIGFINAQFAKKGDDKVHTKNKKEVRTSRRVDLGEYKNNVFLMENAIKSLDKQKVINAVDRIKVLAATENTRAGNNLIDLYKNKQKTDKIRTQIASLEKRTKQMKQRYEIFKNADFNGDPSSKQSAYVHNSIKQFQKYMQMNFDEFDAVSKPTRTKYNPPKGIKLDTTGGNGMISSGKSSGRKVDNNRRPKTENPEIKKYYDQQRLGISKLSKFSRELISNLSSKDYAKANKVKGNILREMNIISANDNTMIRRVDAQEFKALNLKSGSLKKTYASETKLISEFKKLNIPKDNSRLMSLINDFNRLQRHF